MTLCFRANETDLKARLSVKYSFDAQEPRFYSVWVVPWIAEVALVLGTLELDRSVAEWITYLESLGFEDVV